MDRIESARAIFKEGFSCSQAMLAAYGESFGLDRETALRVAAGFGGGMGRMGGTCGAVTGAYMAIGLKHGPVNAKDKERKEKTQQLVREFARRFGNLHGSLICKELLGFDVSTPEGAAQAKEKKIHLTVCANFVHSAAEIVEELLQG